VLFHIQPLEAEPLLTWRLLLFLLPPFLFLLFLRRRLRFRLLALSRRRRLSRYRRRSVLLLALRRRRRLRPRSRLVPVWLGLARYRTSGFGTAIRLWRRRAVIARRWLSRTIRRRAVVRLWRCRLIRLGKGWTI